MHLGNEALTPECVALSMGAAGIGLGLATVGLRREPASRQKVALAAGLGALVFAAQAINVPILPGTSAHLVGGVLLAWTLGPGLGAWTMAIVLAVQALALGDGGLAALGANVLNMALLPAGAVWLCRRLHAAEGSWSHATCGLAAALAVPLAALFIVGETALFRGAADLVNWQDFALRMIGTHLWIGLAEGGLTIAGVAALGWLARRSGSSQPALPRWRPAIAAGGAALTLAAIAARWSSALPDGYEAAAESAGFDRLLANGVGAVAQAQASLVEAVQSITLGEHPALIAAMLLTAALVAAAGLVLSSRRATVVSG